MSLTEVFSHYLEHLRHRGKTSSWNLASAKATLFEETLGDDARADELRITHLDEYITARRGQGIMDSTINTEMGVLRAALHHAVDRGDLEKMPVKVKMLKVPVKVVDILQPHEEEMLLRAAYEDMGNEKLGDILLTALDTGMRHGELLHLHANWVNLENSTLTVAVVDGWAPKTWEERLIPMTTRLAERLAPRVRLAERLVDKWVFRGYEGTPIADIGGPVKEAFTRAGLYSRRRRSGLHQCRRTWASKLLGRGADIVTVMELGGWRNISTVQRYLASTPGRKRDAIRLLEDT